MNMTTGTKTSEAGISSKSVLVFALNMIPSLVSDGLIEEGEDPDVLNGEGEDPDALNGEGEDPDALSEEGDSNEVDDLTNEW